MGTGECFHFVHGLLLLVIVTRHQSRLDINASIQLKHCSLKLPVNTVLYIEPIAYLISLAHLPVKRFHYQRSARCFAGALIYDLG